MKHHALAHIYQMIIRVCTGTALQGVRASYRYVQIHPPPRVYVRSEESPHSVGATRASGSIATLGAPSLLLSTPISLVVVQQYPCSATSGAVGSWRSSPPSLACWHPLLPSKGTTLSSFFSSSPLPPPLLELIAADAAVATTGTHPSTPLHRNSSERTPPPPPPTHHNSGRSSSSSSSSRQPWLCTPPLPPPTLPTLPTLSTLPNPPSLCILCAEVLLTSCYQTYSQQPYSQFPQWP